MFPSRKPGVVGGGSPSPSSQLALKGSGGVRVHEEGSNKSDDEDACATTSNHI
jgi:hypothetical protein